MKINVTVSVFKLKKCVLQRCGLKFSFCRKFLQNKLKKMKTRSCFSLKINIVFKVRCKAGVSG